MAEAPHISACPACIASDAALAQARAEAAEPAHVSIMLSVPTVHCAACIAAIERALEAEPGVNAARVNLTLKRVAVDADVMVTPQHLISVLEGIGYEAHELDGSTLAATTTDRKGRDLLMRLAVAGFAMMNVMLLSVSVWSGAEAATRDMFHWFSALIALPAIAFSARPFFANAWSALRVRRLNMDVPISLAIFLAAALSLYETSQSGENAYFDAALSLTFFLLAGRYLDHRTRAVARSAAQELAAMEVPRALTPDGQSVNVDDLLPGDVVRVLPGARVPVDGVVLKGQSEVDRSLLTGESLPVAIGEGESCAAGEINLTGPLDLRVTAAGERSTLRRLADLVALAENSRNRYTSLADRAAAIYAPAVHILAALAFAGWMLATGDWRLSLNIAVAVLIVTCPCALGLAVPAVTTAASGRLFRSGLLIKSATALERLAEADMAVFDKTGTLTTGALSPANLDALDPQRLSLALALAEGSGHPMSRALAEALRARGIAPAPLEDLQEVPGQGVRGLWNGTELRLGRAAWLGVSGAGPAAPATWLRIGESEARPITFTDTLRDGAAEAVAALKAAGLDVVLLSGDEPGPVADVARRVGIEAWEARMLPEEKAERIALMSRSGRKVLMVGDGLNDTAALASAHVSLSPASALEAARVVSDMVLLGNSLEAVGEALTVARSARRRIKENFALAVLYNLIAVPIALAGLANPLAAALAMSASSITVSLNSMRLLRK